jgi:hypothetical protein
MRAVLMIAVAALMLAVTPARTVVTQEIALTTKLTGLQGTWARDATRGTGGICGVPVADTIALKVSPTEVAVETDHLRGVFKLDGTETELSDGRTAAAALDAGWLAITMKRRRGDYATNVMQEVYIVLGNDLTIWRVLNTVFADGTPGKIDCGNRHAIVYTRQ